MINTINMVFETMDNLNLKTAFEARRPVDVAVNKSDLSAGMMVVARRENYDPRDHSTLFVYDLVLA